MSALLLLVSRMFVLLPRWAGMAGVLHDVTFGFLGCRSLMIVCGNGECFRFRAGLKRLNLRKRENGKRQIRGACC
ncbi:hypothetical protein [Thiohalomonas denitrificans]|uniref:hypothetical protein n=1 Tax=Thiohalomonas denitrificans TaxID=415747 RepID=UPI0026EEFDD0|nr:hypothetical protein [Thiohalomonas denitrificans]